MAESSPRFRRDLVATTTEEEGVTYVDVSDPQTGNSFRFYDYEYQLALQMDGQPVDGIVGWASATYGIDLTAEGVSEFGGRLAELGFMEPEAPAVAPPGAAPVEDMGSSEASWLALQHMRADGSGGGQGAAQDPNGPGASHEHDHGQDIDVEDQMTPVPVTTPPPTRMSEQPTAPARFPSPTSGVPTVPARSEGSGLTEIDSDALEEVSQSGLERSPGGGDSGAAQKTPGPTPPPMPVPALRAPDLGGPPRNGTDKRPTSDMPLTDRAGAPLASAPLPASQRPSAPPRTSTPPPGVAERRQPPSPDRVVMTPFQEEGSRGRFTAPPPSRASRRGPLVVVLVIVAVAAAGGAFYKLKIQHPAEPPAVRVRVVEPKPAAVYRWFSTAGAVVAPAPQPVTFETGGKLAEALPANADFETGAVLAKLANAATLEADLARHQSRVTYYEQQRDGMKTAGNQPEMRQAELKLAEKKKLVDDTRVALAKALVRAPEPGTVLEASAKAGGQVTAKAPVLKWKGRFMHGDFTMDDQDFGTAGKLDFCRVEIAAAPPASARFVDCKLPVPDAVDPNGRSSPLRNFVVIFPASAGVTAGQSIRLARLRYDGVFPVPAFAVVHAPDGSDKVWIATLAGTAELRPVTIVETREEALISKGLAVGDQVIAQPTPDLKEGARVAVER